VTGLDCQDYYDKCEGDSAGANKIDPVCNDHDLEFSDAANKAEDEQTKAAATKQDGIMTVAQPVPVSNATADNTQDGAEDTVLKEADAPPVVDEL
jgi:hypothetical protein